VQFVCHPPSIVDYRALMEAGYGHQEVDYSKNSLAFYYARNCKFALMSFAHYVALMAGRKADAFVSCMVADIVLNDGSLPAMAGLMEEADAVMVHAVQLQGRDVRAI